MKIKRKPLILHNVMSYKVECNKDSWMEYAIAMRNNIIKEGLYCTGPIIYKYGKELENGNIEVTISYPINEQIQLEENSKYTFTEKLEFMDGIVYRQAEFDANTNESYEIIREYAKLINVEIKEEFYNIYLDVYGDGILDIYAPIKECKND